MSRVHFQRKGHGTSVCGHGKPPNLASDRAKVTCLMCRDIADGVHGQRKRDTADDAREHLEAICWRLGMNAVTMQPILIAADRYAEIKADDLIGKYVAEHKRLMAAADRAVRRVA
jgi:hypothetical protein